MSGKETGLSKSALIIIDWQKFFADPSSGAFVKGSTGLYEKLEKAAETFLEQNRPVYASRTFGKEKKEDPFFRFYGKVLKKSDPLFQLAEPFKEMAGVKVFDKNSYSLFENKKFLKELKRKNILKVYLAGLLTDKCLLANAFAAFDKGFEVIVIEDCVISRKKENHLSALSILEESCGHLVKAQNIFPGLKND
jgi:nicotinamidase-related amidase